MSILLKRVIATFLLLCISSISVPAQAEFTVYLSEIENRLSRDNDKEYNHFLNYIFDRMTLKPQVMIVPLANSLVSFSTNVSCIFPTRKPTLLKVRPELHDSDLISSEGVDVVRSHFMTRDKANIINTEYDLSGLTVTTWVGVPLQQIYSEVDFLQQTVSNQTSGLKQLDKYRTDVILGFMPDTFLAARALNLPLPHYNPELIVFGKAKKGINMVCKNTPETQAFLNEFDHHLLELKQSGSLPSFFSEFSKFE